VDSIAQYPLKSLWTVLHNIHWRVCGQYCTVSTEKSVDSIAQYPL